MYADYSFYTGTYHGSLIPEQEFSYREARAAEYINYMTSDRITPELLEADGAAALKIKSCCCALAEGDYRFERNSDKSAEKVGNYSVTYNNRSENSYKLDKAGIVDRYLGNTGLLFRGVKNV
ncbi:MAG: hypothetical protein IJX77_09595 [Ruminococcus sp.]|nr:hypothetical protein [Ruminococcus sp.]